MPSFPQAPTGTGAPSQGKTISSHSWSSPHYAKIQHLTPTTIEADSFLSQSLIYDVKRYSMGPG